MNPKRTKYMREWIGCSFSSWIAAQFICFKCPVKANDSPLNVTKPHKQAQVAILLLPLHLCVFWSAAKQICKAGFLKDTITSDVLYLMSFHLALKWHAIRLITRSRKLWKGKKIYMQSYCFRFIRRNGPGIPLDG